MLCSKCGKKLKKNVKFCDECGTKINQEENNINITDNNESKKKKNLSIEIIFTGLMYLISIALAIVLIIIVCYVPMKTFKDFGMAFVYGTVFYIGLKLVLWIFSIILNKFLNCGLDSEDRKSFIIIYLAVIFIGGGICGLISTKSIFSTILLELLMLLVNLIPILGEFNTDDDYIPSTSSNNYSNNNSIKTGYITDKMGNIQGKSTTYTSGDISKTYVTDNLGNTIVESTTMGNHTTTKINK